jgi:hypothetical protein
VRVPDEAGNGRAKIYLSFPDCHEGTVSPSVIEVPIEDMPIPPTNWGLWLFGGSVILAGCGLARLTGLARGWVSSPLIGMLLGTLAAQAVSWLRDRHEEPAYSVLLLLGAGTGILLGMLSTLLRRRA